MAEGLRLVGSIYHDLVRLGMARGSLGEKTLTQTDPNFRLAWAITERARLAVNHDTSTEESREEVLKLAYELGVQSGSLLPLPRADIKKFVESGFDMNYLQGVIENRLIQSKSLD